LQSDQNRDRNRGLNLKPAAKKRTDQRRESQIPGEKRYTGCHIRGSRRHKKAECSEANSDVEEAEHDSEEPPVKKKKWKVFEGLIQEEEKWKTSHSHISALGEVDII
jgi:hypothetical protein